MPGITIDGYINTLSYLGHRKTRVTIGFAARIWLGASRISYPKQQYFRFADDSSMPGCSALHEIPLGFFFLFRPCEQHSDHTGTGRRNLDAYGFYGVPVACSVSN